MQGLALSPTFLNMAPALNRAALHGRPPKRKPVRERLASTAGTRRSAAEDHPPGSSTHSTSTKACATAARIVRSILCQLRQASISGEASQCWGRSSRGGAP